MPAEPWYLKTTVSAHDGELHGLCPTCRRINFDWLLSHDLASTKLRNYAQQAPSRIPPTELPLGSLRDVVGNAWDCHFCRLIITSFESAYPEFVALEQLNPCSSEDPMVESGFHQRLAVAGREIFTSLRQVEDGVIEFRARPWTPTIESLDPRHAFFELSNVDKGFKRKVGRYSLRVWLCNTQGGQKIANVDFHRIRNQAIPYQGRRMAARIDFELVKTWLRVLGPKDGEGTSQLPQIVQESFMLIDVLEERVVEVSQPCHYVALSYVWGHTNTFLNAKATLLGLKQAQGLSLSNPSLPKTIHDAMLLVLTIGQRYLWVDSLCITQDDEDYKMLQINNMDSIYQCASFTIVAVSGNDASAGLPGVRDGTRLWHQHVESVRGLSLSNRPKMPDYSTSPWSTRAWTLQEAALSARKLFVTPQTVQLHHEHGSFEEDLHPCVATDRSMRQPSSVIEALRDDVLHMNTNFTRYTEVLADYTSRAMSKNTDIINAFKGMMAVLRPTFRSDFLYGLPITELEHALLWLPHAKVKRRIHPETKEVICPSWSWAGWEGGTIGYDCPRAEHLSRVTWLNARTGVPFTSSDIRGMQEQEGTKWLHVHMGQSNSADPDPAYVEPTSGSQTLAPAPKGWSFRHVGMAFNVPRHNSFYRPLFMDSENAVTVFEHQISNESGETGRFRSIPTFLRGTHILRYSAYTASFKLRDVRVRLEDFGPAKRTYEGVTTFGIEDRYGNFAGAVGLHDDLDERSVDGSDAQVQLVVISRTNGPHYIESSEQYPPEYPPEDDNDARVAARSMSQNNQREEEVLPVHMKFFEDMGDTMLSITDGRLMNWANRPFRCYDFDKPWCLYDVLVVRYHGVHAHRIGYGRCHVDAFWRQGSTRRTLNMC